MYVKTNKYINKCRTYCHMQIVQSIQTKVANDSSTYEYTTNVRYSRHVYRNESVYKYSYKRYQLPTYNMYYLLGIYLYL